MQQRKSKMSKGQMIHGAKARSCTADAHPTADGTGQLDSAAGQQVHAPSIGELIDEIRALHKKEVWALKQKNRLTNGLGAYIRRQLGWHIDLPEAERKRITARAQKIIENPAGTEFETFALATRRAAEPFVAIYEENVKAMEKLAVKLPVWQAWGKNVRGFGECSLARIIGETGDLSNYPDKSKLWARLGMGVQENGIRQVNRPQRRSVVWNIGATMLKAQIRKVKDDAGEDTGERASLGDYGAVYLARKAYELDDPEMSNAKAHLRAQRYMEKRLLKDLWQAWRAARSHLDANPRKFVPPSKDSAEMPTDQPVSVAAEMPNQSVADPTYRKRRAA